MMYNIGHLNSQDRYKSHVLHWHLLTLSEVLCKYFNLTCIIYASGTDSLIARQLKSYISL